MLAGKRCLVVGLANHRSLAWGCAQAWRAAGAQVLVSSLPRFQPSIAKLLASSWPEAKAQGPEQYSLACDVMDPESVKAMMARVSERFDGELDVLLHAVAYASAPAMNGPFIGTTAEDFAQAHLVSSHSLITLAREALPLLTDPKRDSEPTPSAIRARKRNSSILTLSYLGAQRAILPYKVMGPAKASLEATVRLLAAELGPPPNQVRVNAVGPGPIHTLSARGIPGFGEMCKEAAARAPLRRNADLEDVGGAAVFLASDAAKAITGQVLYVDGGLNVM
ncbi:enoyl-acp reductase [Nannochloropsis oceanica]